MLAAEALKAAVVEAKAGNDVPRYLAAVAALRPFLGPGDRDGILDQGWIERKGKQNKAETHRLEAELKGYKNNLIKESIRVGSSPSPIPSLPNDLIMHTSRWGTKILDPTTTPSETSQQQPEHMVACATTVLPQLT